MNILSRRTPDYTLPRGIADSFANGAKQLAPAGLPIPDLRYITTDADWLRTHLAHRMCRWIYTVEPISFHWQTFDDLYKGVDREFRERLGDWRWPADQMKYLREDETNAPRPEPKRALGFGEAWGDRARRKQIGSCYNEALTLCTLEAASTAAYYLTMPAENMVIGLPSLGWSMAGVLAYSVQTTEDAFHAGEMWLDECQRIEGLNDLNRRKRA
jgi:hypothetical protein